MPGLERLRLEAADDPAAYVLPEGFPLFQASLLRSGRDLHILAPSGETVTVKDYFDGATAMPGLTRAGGGYMAGDLVASLALPASGGDLAQPVRPAPSAVVGHIASLSGDASVIHGNGLVDSLEVADPVHQGDYLFPRDGSLTIVFADGTRLTVEDGGQVMVRHVAYEPATISGAIALEAAGGRFLLATGSLSEHPGRPIVVETPLARIEIGAASVQFRHDAARGLDVTLLDDLNLREDALVVDNAAGRASAMQAGAHITVADDQQAPLLAEAPERAEPEDFAPAAGLESSAEALAAESADGVEVSPGGDENALPGDPIVVSGTVGFFDLSPQPAPLASPTFLEPSLGAAPSPLVRHDSIATPSLGTLAISTPEEPEEPQEQLRDWEPLGLVWDVSGSAMVTGNAPALPYETDGRQIITTEKLTMAGLALSPDQRPTGELEGFLGLAGGSIAAAGAQGTVPVDGSAIRAKLSLAAGSTLSFDFFFDAGDTVPRNDFAVFSIGNHVYKLADVISAGAQGATGWRTFVYTVSQSGTYTIGFASLNDAVVDNLSALYVDNVRINRALSSGYVVLETTADGAGRVLVLPPVLHDDMLVTSEKSPLSISEAALLANDQANDTFTSLKIVSINWMGTIGHITSGQAVGSLIYNPGSSFRSLAQGETATDTFHYVAKTGEGAAATGAVHVTIAGVNDAPVATGDTPGSVNEDSSPTPINVLTNDDDVDSDDGPASLRIIAAQASAGTVAFTGAPGAGLVYQPGSAFDGLGVGESRDVTITYTIADRHGAQATATVALTVTGVNDAPIARDDSNATTDEDTALTVDVLVNDTDPDENDSLHVDAVFPTFGGARVTINDDGSLTYDPRGRFDRLAAGQSTTETVRYRITDGHGGTAEAVATVTIAGRNDAPVAAGDFAGTGATTLLTLPAAALLVNDTDPDTGDALHLSSVDGSGTIGHVSLQGGSVVYDAGPGFVWLGEGETAIDSFRYVVADTGGGFTTGTVLVAVTGVNDPVTAVDDAYTTGEDDRLVVSAAGVLTNDRDPDLHDTLRVTAVDGRAAAIGQTLVLASGAQVTISASGRLEYDPGSNWGALSVGETRSEHIGYSVSDGQGSVSSGQVTITIAGTNDLPVASADTIVADEDAKVRIGALFNDVDPDVLDVLTIHSVILQAPDGTRTLGTVRINPDNTLTYNPEGQFDHLPPGATATDVFQYVVDDGHGGRDVETVTVTVHGVDNPQPVADQELLDSFEVPAQGPTAVPGATANFGVVGTAAAQTTFVPIDANGHPLPTLSASHLGKMMVLTAAGSSGLGSPGVQSPIEAFLLLPAGALPNDVGTSPTTGAATKTDVALTTADAVDGKIKLSFDWNFVANASDRLPHGGESINDFAVFTVSDGTTSKVFTLSDAERTDWGPSGWRTSVYDVTHDFTLAPGGTLSLTVGFAVLNDATPNNPSNLLLDNVRLNRPLGPDFEADGPAVGGLQTYRQSPSALPDSAMASEDGAIAITASSLLANDFQAHGIDRSTLRIIGVDAQSARGADVAFAGGQVTYDPRGHLDGLSLGETADDTFHYAITDANGGMDLGEVTVRLTGLNDAPMASLDIGAAAENGSAVAIAALANDDDVDSDDDRSTLRIVAASAASGAAVSFGTAAGAALLYNPNSTNVFEGLGLGETAIDTITYTIEDRHGLRASSQVQVTVSGTNDAPVAVNDARSTNEDTVLTIQVLGNDSDPDLHDVLSIGTLSTAGTLGQVSINGDGTLRYDPTAALNGLANGQSHTDTFTYTAADGHGGTSQASVTVTVTGRNDAPAAAADALTTTATAVRTVAASTLLANDTDPDHDPVHVVSVDAASAHGGAVSFDGTSVTYDPAGQFRSLGMGETALDTFSYRIADSAGAIGVGTVTVTVQGVNDAPMAVNDIKTTDEDSDVKILVLDNDSDPDLHDVLSIASIDTTGTRGQVTINVADGSITYDPRGQFDSLNFGQTGHDSFIYRVADGHGGIAEATVNVTITGKPDNQSLVTSFETGFPFNTTRGTVATAASYQETDGQQGLYQPTHGNAMARLEANGATAAQLNTHLGLPAGSVPKDPGDNSFPAGGSAIKLTVNVQAGDQISFDWMFDARDYVFNPPPSPHDQFQDNDFALFTVAGGSSPELFRLADVRSTGDLGATGWRSSIYTSQVTGQLTIGMAAINDRVAGENSFLLVDNVQVNRDFGEGYQVVDTQAQGRFETVVHT